MHAHDFAHDFIAHRFHRFHRTAPVAGRTLITQHVLHAFTSALAGHLYQSKLGEAVNAGFNPVFAQRLLKRVQHPATVIFIVHINEINDDNPTEIAQP